ncbi:MAG: hypothetical protein SX243_13655 [Acidobacteriota bacterium]|nr:hypothetical protein [Acidobacteriota bacterium]
MSDEKNKAGAVLALPWVDLAKMASAVGADAAAFEPSSGANDEDATAPASTEGPEPLVAEGEEMLSSSEDSQSYEDAFRRVSERLQRSEDTLLEERISAPMLYAELLVLPREERSATIQKDPRFQSYLLAEMLLEKSRESWFDSPSKALEGARLALEVAEGLDVTDYGSVLPRSLRLKAQAYLANALRIRGDMRGSEEAFAKTTLLLEDGGALNPYERAEVLSLKASLYKDLARFEEADRLLEEITEVYTQAGDQHQLGRTLLQRSAVLGRLALCTAGDYGEATRILRAGLDLLDPRREPRVVLNAWITLAHQLNLDDRNEEAEDALAQVRAPLERLGERLSIARIRTVEGHIAFSRDQEDEAEKSFLAAREIYMEQGIGIDVALLSLQLALIYVNQGKASLVREMTEEILFLLRSQNLSPEIMAALVLFQHAAEREIATAGLIQEITNYIERSRDFVPVQSPGGR